VQYAPPQNPGVIYAREKPVTPDEMLDDDMDLPTQGEAEDWDEETLGLDFDESDVQDITREISSSWQ
jgi:hypothetical protein